LNFEGKSILKEEWHWAMVMSLGAFIFVPAAWVWALRWLRLALMAGHYKKMRQ
jgi:hypothetical protein